MNVFATADIHSPLYIDLFEESVEKILSKGIKVSLFLIAGDIIERGDVSQLNKVYGLIEKLDGVLIACFGNNEYYSQEEEIIEKCPKITFLRDEVKVLRLNGRKVGIIGSRGLLDEPTFWQRKHIPNISKIYLNRAKKIKKLAKQLKSDIKILLIHYPPTYKILKGENPKYYPQMASSKLESIIPWFNVVVTAHAHNGLKKVFFEGTPIYNVALPLNKEIVEIDLGLEKRGLNRFFK